MVASYILYIVLWSHSVIASSTDHKYQVALNSSYLGGQMTQLNYYLKQSDAIDSILLTSSSVHDLLPPVFWFTADSKNLIFEHKQEGDSLSINMIDLESGDLKWSHSGYFSTSQKNRALFVDVNHSRLIYFESGQSPLVNLYLVDLNTGDDNLILQFKHYDGLETPQVVKFDVNLGIVKLEVKGKDHQTQQLEVRL